MTMVVGARSAAFTTLWNRSIMTTAASKTPTPTRPTASHLELASRACEFLTASTDPFHAVHTAASRLSAGGFVELNPKAPLQPQMEAAKNANKFYYKVHHSTLVSFCVGGKYRPGNGFHVIGGHTDSPNLRVKPKSRRPPKGGVVQLGVECYGGGLWHTWFDRDLSISGKVLVRGKSNKGSEGGADDSITSRLVQFRDPLARISNLAIHLQSADERVAFKVNKEDHTVPVIASDEEKKTKEGGDAGSEDANAAATQLEKGAESQLLTDWHEGHEPLLLRRIADELGIDVGQIADVDLSLYDTQPAALGGMHKEFLYSARLDNLATVFCSIEALLSHTNERLDEDENVSVVVCFDHEEVGSVSTHGAGSPVLQTAIDRIASALGNGGGSDNTETRAVTLQNSFILSVDQAHAVHPNYAGKHEPQHAPMLNRGVVIKTNSNQRYTTNSLTGFVVRELGRKAGVPMQEFCVRNDCPCGSTIGPTISALTGVRTVDLGMPQWSMHSCREVMGTVDLTHGVNLFKTFFQSFKQINDSLKD